MKKTILWMSIYAVAMGFLEAAVVVYLRALYYPQGFGFPLKPIPPPIAAVEFWREIATLFMLIAAGILAGNGRLQRFAYFVFAFALWDLFYYLFLYLVLGWPQSLNTWDILFLVPCPWVGPVWAPCLLCVLMLAGALFTIVHTQQQPRWQLPLLAWLPLITGALVCIVAFLWDYLRVAVQQGSPEAGTPEFLFANLQNYVPQQFNTPLFFSGFVLMALPVAFHIYTTQTNKNA